MWTKKVDKRGQKGGHILLSIMKYRCKILRRLNIMNLGRENEQQEYKESTSELNDAMDDISAILNKHQKGVLYFGVKDDGEVIGFQIGKDTESDISHKIHMFIEPKIYPVIEHIKIETKDVIKVSFDGKIESFKLVLALFPNK